MRHSTGWIRSQLVSKIMLICRLRKLEKLKNIKAKPSREEVSKGKGNKNGGSHTRNQVT